MSKIKSPTEKKRLSLKRDRRNVYGECPTSSRKNIRRAKQRSHMELRRAAKEQLASLKGPIDEVVVDKAEACARDRMRILARSSFRKSPDAPLGQVLVRKQQRREKGATGRKSR